MEQVVIAPGALLNGFLGLCGFIITVWAVIEIIDKIIKWFKKPERDQNERIIMIEKRCDGFDRKFEEMNTFFQNDKERLDGIDKANRVTQQALLALLSHAINGNDMDNLEKARNDLQTYLTNK